MRNSFSFKHSKATTITAGIALVLMISASAWPQSFAQEEENKETNEHVEFAANLEFMKGHLAQAVSNKESGQIELAVAHAGHPVGEIYSLIEKELAEHDAELNADLKASLTALPNQIQTLSTSDVAANVTAIVSMLDQAKSSVIGQAEREDPKFNAMVIVTVLETAELEYKEAVLDGKIVEMVEYQDSTAFIARAETIFDSIKPKVPEHEATEITEFFDDLNALTKANASIGQVETAIGGIMHELEEVYDLQARQPVDGQKIIDNINTLLDGVVTEYKAGNVQEAKTLAVKAYLENYELIEDDIKEDDEELMLKIEEDMRVKLDDMIDAGRPAAEIESHVKVIKADLQTARSIVIPEFPVAIAAVIASMMAIAIAIGRAKGNGRLSPGTTL